MLRYVAICTTRGLDKLCVYSAMVRSATPSVRPLDASQGQQGQGQGQEGQGQGRNLSPGARGLVKVAQGVASVGAIDRRAVEFVHERGHIIRTYAIGRT